MSVEFPLLLCLRTLATPLRKQLITLSDTLDPMLKFFKKIKEQNFHRFKLQNRLNSVKMHTKIKHPKVQLLRM